MYKLDPSKVVMAPWSNPGVAVTTAADAIMVLLYSVGSRTVSVHLRSRVMRFVHGRLSKSTPLALIKPDRLWRQM